jgi:hypothetical protein
MSHVSQSIDLRGLFAVRRASSYRRSICANYARFAELKLHWIASNPEATTTQYDVAMQRLARECGV